MTINDLQEKVLKNKDLFTNSSEIMLAMTEELGEVATEVALLERIGTKKQWDKKGDKERLGEEISHLMNLTMMLANYYEIDLEKFLDK